MKLLENGILFNWHVCRWWGRAGGLLERVCSAQPGKSCKKTSAVNLCRERERGRCVRKRSHILGFFFSLNWRYSHCSSASVTMKPSRQKLKDSAPESLIRTCHRSNEYHLNCFVYWWSLDVDLICACV